MSSLMLCGRLSIQSSVMRSESGYGSGRSSTPLTTLNTAVFNVVNGVLLRPLPYPDSDRITLLWMDNRPQSIREDITSWPTYIDWKTQSTSYAHMAGFRPLALSLTGSGEPERLQGVLVTANFFDVMGIQPMMGR